MKTLTLNVPDSVNDSDVKMQLAAQLFEKGILSSGQAADLVGISKREFIESVGKYGVSVFGETIDDLKKFING
jgi:predicted HTH domain antitoxin